MLSMCTGCPSSANWKGVVFTYQMSTLAELRWNELNLWSLQERTKNAQFIIISLRNNMFELADRLVGIYKTDNVTKTVTINPHALHIPGQPAPTDPSQVRRAHFLIQPHFFRPNIILYHYTLDTTVH